MDIKLPSGKLVQGIPDGTSKEDIRSKLLSSGVAVESDFGGVEVPKKTVQENLSSFREGMQNNKAIDSTPEDEKLGFLSLYYENKDGVAYSDPLEVMARGEVDFGTADINSIYSKVNELIVPNKIITTPTPPIDINPNKASATDIAITAGASIGGTLKNVTKDVVQAGFTYAFGGDMAVYSSASKAFTTPIHEIREDSRYLASVFSGERYTPPNVELTTMEKKVAELAEQGIPTTMAEYSNFAKQQIETADDIFMAKLPENLRKGTEQAIERVRTEAGDAGVISFRQGLLLLSDNVGVIGAGMINPALGFQAMYSNERALLYDEMIDAGMSPEIANEFSAYGAGAIAPIEYVETMGRLKGAGFKGIKRKANQSMTKGMISMLGHAGINVGEELAQNELSTLFFNLAVAQHNQDNPDSKMKNRKHFQNMGDTSKGSISMSLALNTIGLPNRYRHKVKNDKIVAKEKAKADADFGAYQADKIKVVEESTLPNEIKDPLIEAIKKSNSYGELVESIVTVENMDQTDNGVDINKVLPNRAGYSVVDLVNDFIDINPENLAKIEKVMERGNKGDLRGVIIREIQKHEGKVGSRLSMIDRGENVGRDGGLAYVGDAPLKNHVGENPALVDFVNSLDTDTHQKIDLQDTNMDSKVKTTPLSKGQFNELRENEDAYEVYRRVLANEEDADALISLLDRAIEGDVDAQTEWNDLVKSNEIYERLKNGNWNDLSPAERQLIHDEANKKEEEVPEVEKPFEEQPKAQIDDLEPEEYTEEARKKIEKSEAIGEKVKGGMRHFVSISTRIKEINANIATKVRQARQEASKKDIEYSKRLTGFANTLVNVSKQLNNKGPEYDVFKSELLEGDWDALRNRGFTDVDIATFQNIMKEIGEDLGLHIKGNKYFPRAVKDYDGLMKFLDVDEKSPIRKKFDKIAKEKGRALTDLEKNTIVRDYLFLSRRAPVTMARKVKELTPGMAKYYEDPIVSLSLYLAKMSREVARIKYLSLKMSETDEEQLLFDVNHEPSIGDDTIVNLITKHVGIMEPSAEKELAALLKSDLTQEATPQLVANLRSLASIKHASGVTTMISQLGDIGVTMGENGIFNTLATMTGEKVTFESIISATPESLAEILYFASNGEQLKSLSKGEQQSWIDLAKINLDNILTLDKIGIQDLDDELQEARKNIKSKFVDKVFLPLRGFDKYGKGLLLQSTALKWKKLVDGKDGVTQKTTIEEVLKRKLGNVEQEFIDGVISGLEHNRLTPELELALYSQMADFHPINHSEHIKFYIDNPNMRALFILKSFALKRFDRMYREVMSPLVDGIVKVRKGNILNDKALVNEGYSDVMYGGKGFTRFMVFTLMADAIMDTLKGGLKDAFGEDKREDDIEGVEDILPTFFNNYMEQAVGVFPFFNLYTAKKAIEREDIFYYFDEAYEIPKPWGADTAKSLFKYIKDREDTDHWKKDVLFIGPYMDAIENVLFD